MTPEFEALLEALIKVSVPMFEALLVKVIETHTTQTAAPAAK